MNIIVHSYFKKVGCFKKEKKYKKIKLNKVENKF